jgi:hypothetical protein
MVAKRLTIGRSGPTSPPPLFIHALTVGLTLSAHLPLPRFPFGAFSASNYSQSVSNRLTLSFSRILSSTLKMEATRSSETSIYNKPTRCHIPEDGSLHKCFMFATV